jgi:hypothetical protein
VVATGRDEKQSLPNATATAAATAAVAAAVVVVVTVTTVTTVTAAAIGTATAVRKHGCDDRDVRKLGIPMHGGEIVSEMYAW